ncbi:DUF167 domain-containing protein [Candidatus Parcubacteria bacterium]|nr:DUF167 domain-containing protein [Candidatus Parcubacteria bacterium]
MLIKVKVFPDSIKQEIIKKSQDSFEIKVKEAPIRGEANRAVIKVLAEHFPNQSVRLIKGFRERNKVFEVK